MDFHHFPNPVLDRCLYSFVIFGDSFDGFSPLSEPGFRSLLIYLLDFRLQFLMDFHHFSNPVFDRCLYSFLFFGDRLLSASRAVITRAPPYRTPCAEPDRTSLRQTIRRPASDNSQSQRASPAQVLRSSRPLAPSRALLPPRPAPPPRAAPFAPCPPETQRSMPECAT